MKKGPVRWRCARADLQVALEELELEVQKRGRNIANVLIPNLAFPGEASSRARRGGLLTT